MLIRLFLFAVALMFLSFGLWSITIGFHRLVQSFEDVQRVGLADAEDAVKKNYCMLLDGYGWQPLEGWDAAAVEERIRLEFESR